MSSLKGILCSSTSNSSSPINNLNETSSKASMSLDHITTTVEGSISTIPVETTSPVKSESIVDLTTPPKFEQTMDIKPIQGSRSSHRKRTKVKVFEIDHQNKDSIEFQPIPGRGMALKEFPWIAKAIRKCHLKDCELLKSMYPVLFGQRYAIAKIDTIKNHILSFNGFPYDSNDFKTRESIVEKIWPWTSPYLKDMLRLFQIDISKSALSQAEIKRKERRHEDNIETDVEDGMKKKKQQCKQKERLINIFMDWLECPSYDGLKTKDQGTPKKKKASPSKSSGSKKKNPRKKKKLDIKNNYNTIDKLFSRVAAKRALEKEIENEKDPIKRQIKRLALTDYDDDDSAEEFEKLAIEEEKRWRAIDEEAKKQTEQRKGSIASMLNSTNHSNNNENPTLVSA